MNQLLSELLVRLAAGIFRIKIRGERFSLAKITQSARRVLVIPPSGLAEIMLIYPAMTVLRKALPDSKIVCLLEREQVEVLRNLSGIDEYIDLPDLSGISGIRNYMSLIADVKEKMIEAVFFFDFRRDFYRMVLPLLCKAKVRVHLKNDIGYPLFNVEVIPRNEETYLTDLSLCLVSFLGGNDKKPEPWRLSESEQRIAREIVRLRKSSSNELLVAVDLSYTKSGEKPPYEIALKLVRAYSALVASKIVLLSDTRPGVTVEETQKIGSFEWFQIKGKNFRDTLGMLSQCDLLISANTNLFHFAITMGTPTFGLFSRKDGPVWIPKQGRFEIVQEQVWMNMPPAELAMRMRDFVKTIPKKQI